MTNKSSDEELLAELGLDIEDEAASSGSKFDARVQTLMDQN